MGAEASQAKLIEDLHHLWQAVVFALLRGEGVKLHVVVLGHVCLLPLSHDLDGESVEDDLVEHDSEAKNIVLLGVAF